jgi:hypothetical protein
MPGSEWGSSTPSLRLRQRRDHRGRHRRIDRARDPHPRPARKLDLDDAARRRRRQRQRGRRKRLRRRGRNRHRCMRRCCSCRRRALPKGPRTRSRRSRSGSASSSDLARCANSLRSSTIDMVSLRYRPPFQTLIAAGVLIQIVAPSHPRLDNSSAGNRAKRRLKNTRHLLSLVGHKPFLLNLNRRDAARFLPHCRPTASLRWPNVLFRDCPRCRLSAEYGDVYFGHFPKIPKRLIGPPLSTRASLHAWSWSEVA